MCYFKESIRSYEIAHVKLCYHQISCTIEDQNTNETEQDTKRQIRNYWHTRCAAQSHTVLEKSNGRS